MGAIEWGVLFCAACLIIGSFSYIKPSPKQKREAKIRMKAIHLGLRVKQMHLDDLSVAGRVNKLKRPFVFFQAHVPEKKGADKRSEIQNTWMIQRTTGECGIHLKDGWSWVEKNSENNSAKNVIDFLKEFLEKQPENIHAIEVNKFYVAIAWDEKPDEMYLDTVKLHLDELLKFSLN